MGWFGPLVGIYNWNVVRRLGIRNDSHGEGEALYVGEAWEDSTHELRAFRTSKAFNSLKTSTVNA